MGTRPEPDPGLSAVMNERRQLINLTYRMLGSLAEAEDAVQETYARWYAMSREQQAAIESPGAWLTTVASRICLDLLGSARARRERYVGEWLPEPLPGSAGPVTGSSGGAAADPADRVTLDESVNMAFLVVLESMTPAERVAFILHDVYGYPFAEVAQITGRTPAACRQLASSARRRVRNAQDPKTPATPTARQARLVRDFKRAWQAQDIGTLVSLLDPGVTMTADGGGLATAALHPVEGGEQVARYLADLAALAAGQLVLAERTVNGQPGLVGLQDGRTVTVFAFDIADDRIRHIWAVRNPDKLRPWALLSRPKLLTGPPKAPLSRRNKDFRRRGDGGLTTRLNGDGEEIAAHTGGTMNRTMTHDVQGPLARIRQRVAAFVAECNDAQSRLASAQHTPERY